MSNTIDFVHLSVHTDASLYDGLGNVKKIATALQEKNMHSMAITDDGNFFNAIKHYKTLQSKGMKPILGADIKILEEPGRVHNLTFIVKNNVGYKNLTTLLSKMYEDGYVGEIAYCKKEWIEEYSEGLICLTGARHGSIGKYIKNNQLQQAEAELVYLLNIFKDNLYIELQRTGHPDDEHILRRSIQLAKKYKAPVVATNNVRFISPDDFTAHQVRCAISDKSTLDNFNQNYQDRYTVHQYLKTPEEMHEIFKDIPSAIQNTVEISKRCNIEIDLGNNYLPVFPTPNNETEDQYLTKSAKEGLQRRLSKIKNKLTPELIKEYEDRLDFELKIINEMGFPGYFLIVSDFIQWSKENGIPVGPGRGSGAGSLVAYSLDITDLDPIEYDLLFERFLNPERVSMPDFDIDFCKEGRDKVIKYVADKYGHDSVSQIVTFGTLSAKSVVRDVARVLGKPYSFGSKVAGLIPNTVGIKLKDVFEDETFKIAYNSDEEIRKVIDYAVKLEGLYRQTGKHAGGVLIGKTKLTDFTPTYNTPKGDGFVSQYDKNDVEEAGLVKFDFLGLKTLTVINDALININKKIKEPINILDIDRTDQKTYEKIFLKAETTAVFQLESKGMKDLIKRLKPENFDDIIALVALYRPGPMDAGMVDTYVECKNGIKEVELLHPLLDKVLGATYGVLVYQEQVMQTAQVLAGYTLGGADMLRRAMGKKKPEEMEKQRSIFVEGCKKTNNIDENEANRIFNLIEKFAGYGFNKSHSAAYALIAFQTAWLKAHYPSEFMAAVLSIEQNDIDKVVSLISECKEMKLNVIQPCVNLSTNKFTTDNNGNIVFSMTAISGIGDSEVNKIIKEREENGIFTSFEDFILRVNPKKTTIEAGIKSGLFDNFNINRATLFENYANIKKSFSEHKKSDTSQIGLFNESDIFTYDYQIVPEWNKDNLLKFEKDTMGMYITGHPLDKYGNEFDSVITGKLKDLIPHENDDINDNENIDDKIKESHKTQRVTVAGIVNNIKIIKTNNGKMASLIIDDGTRQIEAVLYSKNYQKFEYMLETGVLIFSGVIFYDKDRDRHKFNINDIQNINMFRERKIESISINTDNIVITKELEFSIKELLSNSSRGGTKIILESNKNNKKIQKVFDSSFDVLVTDQLLDKLNELTENNIVINYKGRNPVNHQDRIILQESLSPEIKKERERQRLLEFNIIAREAQEIMGL